MKAEPASDLRIALEIENDQFQHPRQIDGRIDHTDPGFSPGELQQFFRQMAEVGK